jgi:hypothetical protein
MSVKTAMAVGGKGGDGNMSCGKEGEVRDGAVVQVVWEKTVV